MSKKRKHGSGTLRKRTDGRWEARVVIGYDEKGKPITKNVTANEKSKCLEKLEKLKEEINFIQRDTTKADMPFGERCDHIARFVRTIDNWGICDSFCASLKFARRYPDMVWKWIEPYFASHHPYEVRFALVMEIFYFASEEYIDDFFERISHITADDYYVKMAVAWVISVYYVNCPAHTKRYLMSCDADPWIYRKALTKIIESKRVSDEEKAWIRECRNKIKK